MDKSELKKVDRRKLPWFYRLILKVPGADFLEGSSSGIFWGIIVPIFLTLEFFFSIFLLLFFSFPINIILTATVPIAVLLIFIRISLERFINWWNLMLGESGFKWDVEKTMQEYLALLKEKEKKKE